MDHIKTSKKELYLIMIIMIGYMVVHLFYPVDISKIFELRNLKKVSIHRCNIYKQDEFVKNLKNNGIEVDIIEDPNISL